MNCVSLFSGCGGLDLGAEQAGFKIVLANDNEKLCQESSKVNFPQTEFIHGSVTNLTSNVLKNKLLGVNVDLLIGGPPCPSFSKSRFYLKEKKRGMADPIGHETVHGYLSVLEDLNPTSFLFENVNGFSFKVHSEAFDYVLQRAKELGYNCSWKVVNAADYGVPQMRKRFILVGVKTEEPFIFPDSTHCDPKLIDSLNSKKLKPWATTGEAINDLDTEENANDKGHFAGGKHHDLLCKVPPGENYLFFTQKRGHPNPIFEWRSRYWSFLLKLSPSLPSWTIQAKRSNNMGPLHWRNRILRIEEVKRLQSFPDNWFLAGTIEQQWRQVGNAVPPPLAKALARAIMEHIS